MLKLWEYKTKLRFQAGNNWKCECEAPNVVWISGLDLFQPRH